MTRQTFTVLLASALATSATPAFAQSDGDLPPLPPLPEAAVEPAYPLGDYPEPAYPGGPSPYEIEAATPVAAYPSAPGLPPLPAVSYVRDERETWLKDCRAQYHGKGRDNGGLLGGLLGAVTGGVIGNRVADGERLAGTLIGAGVGGIAGVAIGAAIGAASDREKIDECEAYLRRHESGYGYDPGHAQHYGYGYPAYAYPMMMVPVTIKKHYVYSEPLKREKRIVVDEWIDEQVVETKTVSRPGKYVKRQPAAAGKTIRSTK